MTPRSIRYFWNAWRRYNSLSHCIWSSWGKYEWDIFSPISVSQLFQASVSTGQLKSHLFILLAVTVVKMREDRKVAGKAGDEKCSLKQLTAERQSWAFKSQRYPHYSHEHSRYERLTYLWWGKARGRQVQRVNNPLQNSLLGHSCAYPSDIILKWPQPLL